jgi:predicted nucleic acid-binding protein
VKCVVADTNVLVSALQFGGKPKQLLDLAVDGQIDLAVSTEIVAETLRVLGQKFDRGSEWLTEADRQLRVIARIVVRPRPSKPSKLTRRTIGFWNAPPLLVRRSS